MNELNENAKYGFEELDQLTGGLHKGELILVGARPGMGKSSFALNIAAYVAKINKKVLYITLEMSKELIESRLVLQKDNSEEKYSENPNIYIDDTPGIYIGELRNKLMSIKEIDLVIIDYLQLISCEEIKENRQLELSFISRNLKSMAKEFNVSIICLSQLSRRLELRENKRPVISDLCELGGVEQDFDTVLFLFREKDAAECIIAKARYGKLKTIDMMWNPSCMRFVSNKIESKEQYIEERNIWLDGIMGVVVGDALGVPVEFLSRAELKINPVEDMRGFGSFNLPKGTWSDDSSMTLATMESLTNGYHLEDIMDKFVLWLRTGRFTPFGNAFDVGNICHRAISKYSRTEDVTSCGCANDYENGNGSLMRIMPVCLYFYEKQTRENLLDTDAIEKVHEVSALTHAHERSKIACGIYYFLVKSILDNNGSIRECLQVGINNAFTYYKKHLLDLNELKHYKRLRGLNEFLDTAESEIQSSAYVVDSLEAAIWCLINTNSYSACVLKAVNLGDDTDTVAAIAGGLAGLYYGYENMPKEWLIAIQKREWIEELCHIMYK